MTAWRFRLAGQDMVGSALFDALNTSRVRKP